MKRKLILGLIVSLAAVMFTSCIWWPYSSANSTNYQPFETTISNVSYSHAYKDGLLGNRTYFDQITITLTGNTSCFTAEHFYVHVTDPSGAESTVYIADSIPSKPAAVFYCNLTDINGSTIAKDFLVNGSTITVGAAIAGGVCPNYTSYHQHTLVGTATCKVSK